MWSEIAAAASIGIIIKKVVDHREKKKNRKRSKKYEKEHDYDESEGEEELVTNPFKGKHGYLRRQRSS